MTLNQFKSLINFPALTPDQLLNAILESENDRGSWPTAFDISLVQNGTLSAAQALTIVRLFRNTPGAVEKINSSLLTGVANGQQNIDAVLTAIKAGAKTEAELIAGTGLTSQQIHGIILYLQNSGQIGTAFKSLI
jgi:uncharacterized protein YaaQ